jgi:hypothetical protein
MCREKSANAKIVVHLNLDLRAKLFGDVQIADLVIEAQTRDSNQQGLLHALLSGKLQSFFEIGGVLARPMNVLRVRKSGAGLGKNRIEIADNEIRHDASLARAIRPAIGAQNDIRMRPAFVENGDGGQEAIGNDERGSVECHCAIKLQKLEKILKVFMPNG